MFISQLKKDGVSPEVFEAIAPRPGFVRVKRPQSAPTPSPLYSETGPIQTPSSAYVWGGKGIYADTPEEELQWLYENRQGQPVRRRHAIVDEMSRRGLL